MKPLNFLAFLLLVAFAVPSFAGAKGLIVHEWGTFTSFQDERGNAIGGINIDDEPVPPFVHRLRAGLILNDLILNARYQKGIPACHPDVTMRLETPVIYFHRAPGEKVPRPITVSAQFNGGWISEWFPYAKIKIDRKDVTDATFKVGRITEKTTTRVTWNLVLGGKKAPPPETTWHVWTTPRRVMIGRIELVTPRQRRQLASLAAGTLQREAQTKVYESLGRFREALILNEAANHPTAALHQFMATYGIVGFSFDAN